MNAVRIAARIGGIAGQRPSGRDHRPEKPYERQFRTALADAMKKHERTAAKIDRLIERNGSHYDQNE